MMSRKHYAAIAKAIAVAKAERPENVDAAFKAVVHEIAKVMAADNERFSWERFVAACE